MADRPNVEEVFEAWAHVAARVRKRSREERETILSGLGIGPEWDAVHEMWSKRLNEDILANRMDRPQRYARICREEQQRRNRTGAGPTSGAPETAPAAPAPAPPAPAAAPPIGAPPFQPLTGGSGPPPPIPQTPGQPTNVQLGVTGSPVLGVNPIPNAAAKPPMRRRAETLDIKESDVEGDAIPFNRARGPRPQAATVDFRDMVTPQRSKPSFPWMAQEETLGLVNTGEPAPPDERPSGAPASDFRRDLGVEKRPTMPRPNQDDTASGVDLGATVEAARQVSEVMSWTVERWARLCVALERHPHNAEAIWRDHGVTSSAAQAHATAQWQRKLDKEPSVKAEMMGHLDRLRALP